VNEYSGTPAGAGRRFALIVSRFNSLVTERLLVGARECLLQHGVDDDGIDVYSVPGAWELPQAAARVVGLGRHDGVIALGCVIRGDTAHFEYVAGEASRGLGEVARSSPLPVTFGVLTTDSVEQALERAGSEAGNKGWEAAISALEMADLFEALE
jgi:6,7-dimethyl-8-ribityllumazine synthase